MPENIAKLVHQFKDGIKILLKFIENEYPSIFEILMNPNSTIEYKLPYSFFVELTKKSWFKDNIKEVEVPISIITLPDKNETIKIKKNFILDDVLNLFEKEYPIPFKKIYTIISHYTYGARRIIIEDLFYLVFYKLFNGHVHEEFDIEVILNSLIKEWNEFLQSKTMPIKLRIDLSLITFPEELQEDDHFKFTHISEYYIKKDASMSFQFFSYLIYSTTITPIIYDTEESEEEIDSITYKNNLREQGQQYSLIYYELKKFLACLYLRDYEISNYIPQIELPWWFPNEDDSFQNIPKNLFYIPRDWPKTISRTDYKDILALYDNLKNNSFFHKKCFPLTRSLMELAISHKRGIDRVFDTQIFLEFLFGPGDQGEISFRVSLNAALFISDNFKEFKKNYYFFKSLYDVRSGAIHGGDWLAKSTKMLTKMRKIGWEFSNINQMFKHIEKMIRIIMQKFNGQKVNFLEFRKKVNNNPLLFFNLAEFIDKSDEPIKNNNL